MNERNDAPRDVADARPASLILVEQSGVKHEIPQVSPVVGIIEAEHAMHGHRVPLREVKVVSQHQAIARWKAGELGWRRVACPVSRRMTGRRASPRPRRAPGSHR